MDVQSALFIYLIIVFSSVIHEYSHGLAAYQLGDPTAKNSGRLTLNPLVHLDLFGTVLLPFFLLLTAGAFLGYAKPVPFNPLNLRNPKRDTALIGIAGPGSNLLVALILGLVLRFFGQSGFLLAISPFLAFIVLVNIWLALFNLIPLAPLDGSKVLFGLAPSSWQGSLMSLERIGFWGFLIALFLAMTFLPYLSEFVFKLIVG